MPTRLVVICDHRVSRNPRDRFARCPSAHPRVRLTLVLAQDGGGQWRVVQSHASTPDAG
jgi:hypothetical protein